MDSRIIIVGGGTSGALLAERLSRDTSREVVVLERGPGYSSSTIPPYARFSFMASSSDNTSCAVRERGELLGESIRNLAYYSALGGSTTVQIPRGELLGGSSQLNAGIWLHGLPADFEEWTLLGNPAWSYREVAESYRAVECDGIASVREGKVPIRRSSPDEFVAVSRAFVESCLSLGYPHCDDFNRTDEGVGPLPFNIGLDGIRYGSGVVFLTSRVRDRSNLHITCNATVSRILFDGTRAVGICYERDGIEQIEYGDKVIICAGPIRTPHLLLLSGLGPADALERLQIPVVHDSPGVGRSLQDHPCVNLYWELQDEVTTQLDHTGMQVALRYGSSSGLPVAAAQINCYEFGYGMTDEGVFKLDRRKVGMACHLYRSLSKGSVTLDPECAKGPPIVNYAYLSSTQDLNAMRIIVREAFTISAARPLKNMLADPSSAVGRFDKLSEPVLSDQSLLDQWLLHNVVTGQHTSSTCRMGPASDSLAVVDEMGHVYGTTSLQIIDSSIMPTCLRANTCAPTMMLAEHIWRRCY